MTLPGIWTQNDEGWKLSRPEGFPDEATLHGLIEETPEMLPLSGAPALLILGREVSLGSGYADLVGVETSGRPVIIEVKLAQNNEARRAVVAQILAYAANLHGTTREQLEGRFGKRLRQFGHESLVDAVASVREDAFDADEFTEALDEHLSEGRFRLVFVLDSVPAELMTLVAYLEHVTDKLVIDLVAVNSFDVSGTSVVLPQRVTPERHEVTVEKTRRKETGTLYPGGAKFEEMISRVPAGEPRDAPPAAGMGSRPRAAGIHRSFELRGCGSQAVHALAPPRWCRRGIGHHLERRRCVHPVLAKCLREASARLHRADRGASRSPAGSGKHDPEHQRGATAGSD